MCNKKDFYYGFLDTLRTIAMVLVLLRHSIRPFLSDVSPEATIDDIIWIPVKNLMANGWVGVDLFFLLSGFLIAQPFLKSSGSSIKKFYLNRVLRIFPAYFTVLALVIAGAFPYYVMAAETSAKAIISHIFFMQDYTGSQINIVFWSLGVELKFYLLAPFVLILTGRYVQSRQWLKAYAPIITIILLAPLLRLFIYTSYGGVQDYYEFFRVMRSPFHVNLDGLFFGVLLALLFKQIQPHIGTSSKTGKKWVQFLFVSLCCGTVYFLMSHEFHAEITFFDAVFQTFILSMLFFGVALLGLCCLDTYTAGPVSRWGAKLSYSTYLVHWPLVPSCLFLPAIFGIGSVYHSLDSALFFMVGLWTTSLILAFMIYTLIETPFLRFKSKKS